MKVHKAKYRHSQWFYYLLPRRLTLKHDVILEISGHQLPVGTLITVSGTTNYDGTYKIEKTSPIYKWLFWVW